MTRRAGESTVMGWRGIWCFAFDALDAARARRERRRLWRRAWLVSWDRPAAEAGTTWVARLSCPQLPITVARRGRSRCQALGRARAALDRLLSNAE
jgi:hypothetical protein